MPLKLPPCGIEVSIVQQHLESGYAYCFFGIMCSVAMSFKFRRFSQGKGGKPTVNCSV